jgi:hypothetical protein
MNDLPPMPPKPRKHEYRGSTCPKHANRCAERRFRHTQGPYECVFCVISDHIAALTQEGQET